MIFCAVILTFSCTFAPVMKVVSSYLPFPCISWWARAINATTLLMDGYEHFEKMTYRNKYRICGANNPIQLSIPVTGGREQRRAMKEVTIHNQEKWQVQHWRTLVSVYSQSPFWEYYEPSLKALYEQPFSHLSEFNKATVVWCLKQLKCTIQLSETSAYSAFYDDATDLRRLRPIKPSDNIEFPGYYQVFADRIGFQPDLSILDLLFSEGPNTLNWIREHFAAPANA